MSGTPVLPKVLAALEHAPAGLTRGELRSVTGVCPESIRLHIRRLYDERAVHIAGWKLEQGSRSRGGVYQARYALGAGEDAPKPIPLTQKEMTRRYWAKARKNAGALAELRAQRAEAEKRRYWRAKPVRRDALVSALFGAPVIAQERARMREEQSHA